ETPDPAEVGQSVIYTITVTNNGPDTASGVSLSDTLTSVPNAIGLVISATAKQGNCATTPDSATCDLGALELGERTTIRIVARPIATGQLINLPSVTGTEHDPNILNNSAGRGTEVHLPTANSEQLVAPKLLATPLIDGDCSDTNYGDAASVA